MPLRNATVTDGKEVITAGDKFQVSVTTENQIDCAGQFIVTAAGAPGAPSEVLVQSQTYIIGPASGDDSVTGAILASNGTPVIRITGR